MDKLLISTLLFCFLNGCINKKSSEKFTETTDRISIFEVYFRQPESVNRFGIFLRDTLELPVEWEPFDFFGNRIVYDAAYFLGNTSLELLAFTAGDSAMNTSARFNRVLFESRDIEAHSNFLKTQKLQHTIPFDFNISSQGSELQIGRQINLDSISKLSNVNVAFWQYNNSGFNFSERSISANNERVLTEKLAQAFESNPLGIVGLKDIHLTIDQKAEEQWVYLLGEAQNKRWNLKKGPSISYDLHEKSIGLDRISIQVNNMGKARDYLNENQIGFTEGNGWLIIDKTKVYGLNIVLEE